MRTKQVPSARYCKILDGLPGHDRHTRWAEFAGVVIRPRETAGIAKPPTSDACRCQDEESPGLHRSISGLVECQSLPWPDRDGFENLRRFRWRSRSRSCCATASKTGRPSPGQRSTSKVALAADWSEKIIAMDSVRSIHAPTSSPTECGSPAAAAHDPPISSKCGAAAVGCSRLLGGSSLGLTDR
jgi:hypothetical protein